MGIPALCGRVLGEPGLRFGHSSQSTEPRDTALEWWDWEGDEESALGSSKIVTASEITLSRPEVCHALDQAA